jgi:outer membrane protein assembly factor BamD
LKSSYELAVKSIFTKVEQRLNNTLEAFLVFNDNYPESKYIKQAEKINQQTTESINKLK